MKKILSRVLVSLNALLILLLLLLSGVMIYMTAAKPAEIFGHTAVLVEGSSGTGTLCIVDRHSVQLVPEDTLLLRGADGALELILVDRNDGRQLYYKDASGGQLTIPVDDERIQGRVTSENAVLGEFFSVIVRSDNLKTTYVCIGTGFAFCVLAILLIYFLSSKLAAPFAETEEERELLEEILTGGADDACQDEEEDGGQPDTALPEPLNASGERPAATPFPQLAKLRSRRAQPAAAGEAFPPRDAPPEKGAAAPRKDPPDASKPALGTDIPTRGDTAQRAVQPPAARSAAQDEEDGGADVKIYTPHSLRHTAPLHTETVRGPGAMPAGAAAPADDAPAPVQPPAEEPQIVVHTGAQAYDLYDFRPDISELLNDIEQQFRDLNGDKQ